MKVIKKYQCTNCYYKHDSAEDAKHCCPREVENVFECPFCGRDDFSSEDSAQTCLDEHLAENLRQQKIEDEEDEQ